MHPVYKKRHNRGLNPEHHTQVRQRLKTLRYLMADPMFVVRESILQNY